MTPQVSAQYAEQKALFNEQRDNFFRKLDWVKVLKDENIPYSKNVLNNQERFSKKGSYISIKKERDGRQVLFIDDKEFKASYAKPFSGPTASGSEVERAERYKAAAALSPVMADNALEHDQTLGDKIAANKLLEILAGPDRMKQLAFIDKHARIQREEEWETLLNKFEPVVQRLAYGAEQSLPDTDLAIKLKASLSPGDNYYSFQKMEIDKNLTRIATSVLDYKRVESKMIKSETLRLIKDQVDMFKIVEDYTSQKPQRIDANEKTDYKGQFAVDCPFSEKGSGYKMYVNKNTWASENPAASPEKFFENENRSLNDVYTFIQMKERCSFQEAVETVAAKINYNFKPQDFIASDKQMYKKGDKVIEILNNKVDGTSSFIMWPTKKEKEAGKTRPVTGGALELIKHDKQINDQAANQVVKQFFADKWMNMPWEAEAFYARASMPGIAEARKDTESLLFLAECFEHIRAVGNGEGLTKTIDQMIEVGKKHGVNLDGLTTTFAPEISESQSQSQELNK